MEKLIIKFIGPWRGYSKDELAGFPEDIAQSLINAGRAELQEAKKSGKAGATKPKSTQAAKEPPRPGPAVDLAAGADGGGDPAAPGLDDDEAKP